MIKLYFKLYNSSDGLMWSQLFFNFHILIFSNSNSFCSLSRLFWIIYKVEKLYSKNYLQNPKGFIKHKKVEETISE